MALGSIRMIEPPVSLTPPDSTDVVRSYRPGTASGGTAIADTGVPPAWLVVCTGLAVVIGEGTPSLNEPFSCATSANEPVNDADSVTGTGPADREGAPDDTIQCTYRTSPGWTS